MATGSQPIFYCLTSGNDAIEVLRPVLLISSELPG